MKSLREKGITLVALVVTIVIMLILAGVTLNLALGENGLFKMAQNSVALYKEKSIEEERELDNLMINYLSEKRTKRKSASKCNRKNRT